MLARIKKGSGKAIVFLHGFCESKEYWLPAVDALKNSFCCISIDLPGHGKSRPMLNASIEDMAYEVIDTLTKLHIYEFILVGHSMGGYVSLAIAEQFPEKIEGLCLCNSTALADSNEKKQQRNKTVEFLKENGVEAFIRPFVPPLFHPQNRSKCEDIIRVITENGIKLTETAIATATIAMRNRPNRTLVLRNLQVPVCFIIGKNDTAVKFEDILPQLAMPENAYIQINDPCGHQSFYEYMPQTIQTLQAFINICQTHRIGK